VDLADHGKSWVYPSLKAGLASVMTLNFVNAVRRGQAFSTCSRINRRNACMSKLKRWSNPVASLVAPSIDLSTKARLSASTSA
jgi:hypothetical protein